LTFQQSIKDEDDKTIKIFDFEFGPIWPSKLYKRSENKRRDTSWQWTDNLILAL